jgi:hypothetical protein
MQMALILAFVDAIPRTAPFSPSSATTDRSDA